jgi:hypothetical protein
VYEAVVLSCTIVVCDQELRSIGREFVLFNIMAIADLQYFILPIVGTPQQ